MGVPEPEGLDVSKWAQGLLKTAESWPDDGPHLQPKQFVRGLVLRVAGEAVESLQAQVEQAQERESVYREFYEADRDWRRYGKQSRYARRRKALEAISALSHLEKGE